MAPQQQDLKPQQKDTRNVIDYYKYWTEDAIRADLDEKRQPLKIAIEHWQGDFNIGTVVRNANAFTASETIYIGKRQWDKRGAVGTYIYEHVTHMTTLKELKNYALENRYVIVGVDNVDGSQNLHTYQWPENVIMLFGEEGPGLTPEALALCEDIVYIPQYGSVRSLNAGVASGITMYAWAQQHNMKEQQ